MIVVTGGAGFIGSHFVNWTPLDSIVIDKMTYAADKKRITNKRAQLLRENICAGNAIASALASYKPQAIFHFAAETHVTKSIEDPSVFFRNNVDGTLRLLRCTLDYWKTLDREAKEDFRFVHISTDEVFGGLGPNDAPFTEDSPHRPSTPYAASKAASDHIVRCFNVTYGLPTLIINSANNYGIGQHKEKLIPLTISNALAGKPLTVHGDGFGTRDWIHVEDFCSAIWAVFMKGTPGEAYVAGAMNERRNIDVIETICDLIDGGKQGPTRDLITYVPDRPGNDRRYALRPDKLMALGWSPSHPFDLRPIVESMMLRVAA